jgi:hypothetical protein
VIYYLNAIANFRSKPPPLRPKWSLGIDAVRIIFTKVVDPTLVRAHLGTIFPDIIFSCGFLLDCPKAAIWSKMEQGEGAL